MALFKEIGEPDGMADELGDMGGGENAGRADAYCRDSEAVPGGF
jgi:hypothetical protein